MVESIVTVDPLLIAHIAAINGDPNGKGNDFEAAASHLMLADPVERKAVQFNNSKRKRNSISISSALAGRGELGVDFRWHNRQEFKVLTSDQKDELLAWRSTPSGQQSMKEAKDKFKAQVAAKKAKKEEEAKTEVIDEAQEKKKNNKLKKKYQAAVAKAAKKIVAASLEADKAEVAAADQQLEAALKRRAVGSAVGAAVISATSVVEEVDDEVAAEKKFNEQQKKIKLASVKSRLSKMSKKVTLKVD